MVTPAALELPPLREDTGVIVRRGRYCEVVGSGDVIIVVDGREMKRTNAREAKVGESLGVRALLVVGCSLGPCRDPDGETSFEVPPNQLKPGGPPAIRLRVEGTK